MYYGTSDMPYVSVEDAARMLRVSAWTLYRNLDDVPHVRIGPYIRIRCEFLLLEPPKTVSHQDYSPQVWQPMLPFDITPVKVWRNSKKPVMRNAPYYPMHV